MPDAPLSLVLLPGLDGTGRLFVPLLRELPATLRPVVVSYPADESLGYEALLPLAARALPADGPFVLLGESFSGPLALMLAARNPPGLRGVILCASFVRSPVPLPRLSAALRGLVRGWTVRLCPSGIRFRSVLDRAAGEEPRRLLAEVHAAANPAVLAARLRAVLTVDAAEALVRCPVPVLYLAASRDRLVRRRSLELIQRLRPDVRAVSLDAPHLLLQSAPAAAARAIMEFVGALDRAPAGR